MWGSFLVFIWSLINPINEFSENIQIIAQKMHPIVLYNQAKQDKLYNVT